jgi:hypothetical protein
MLFWLNQFFSNRAFHFRALEEVIFIAIVSIIPLLILPFVASVKAPAEVPFDLGLVIWTAIASGQLYLYSFSLFGTIMWLCVEDVSSKAFAPRKYFVLAGIILAFLCMLVYGIDPGLSKPLNPILIDISIFIYVIYLLMYYALLVFKMLRAPSIDDTVEANVVRLIRQSQNRREHNHD